MKYKIPAGAGLIILAYIAFISLGLPDGLLGVAWPSIRYDFLKPIDSLGMMLVGATFGYLLSSFYSGYVIAYIGVGRLLALSCAATGASMIAYTLTPYWWTMVPLTFIAGLGAGAIDAGVNSYVAANYGERLMQWLHASYGIGITMGPLIMTAGINIFKTWRLGYIIVGTAQILLAISFAFTSPMWEKYSKNKNEDGEIIQVELVPILETLSKLKVWLSLSLFFVYSGVEVSIGSWAYSLLTESRGISPAIAGLVVGSYWGMFTAGRFLAGVFTRYIPIHKMLKISMVGALAGTILLIVNPFGLSSLIAVAIIGFAIAPIFPGMVSLTSLRVGERYVVNTIGMQMSAAGLGAALLPSLTGVIARHTSLEVIPYMVAVWAILLMVLYGAAGKIK